MPVLGCQVLRAFILAAFSLQRSVYGFRFCNWPTRIFRHLGRAGAGSCFQNVRSFYLIDAVLSVCFERRPFFALGQTSKKDHIMHAMEETRALFWLNMVWEVCDGHCCESKSKDCRTSCMWLFWLVTVPQANASGPPPIAMIDSLRTCNGLMKSQKNLQHVPHESEW